MFTSLMGELNEVANDEPDDFPIIRPSSDFPAFAYPFHIINGEYVLTSDRLCLHMSTEELWQPGYYWDSLESLPEINISIDNEHYEGIITSGTPNLIIHYDEENNVIGIHNTSYDYCVNVALSSGNHIVEIEIIRSPDDVLRYHWEFIVES